MCAIGRSLGKRMRALITRMDQPLGRAVGNAVEVAECVACLRGEQGRPRTWSTCRSSWRPRWSSWASGPSRSRAARALCRRTLADGSALDRFRRLVAAQGGDPRVLDDPGALARRHGSGIDIPAPHAGIVQVAGRPADRPGDDAPRAPAGRGSSRRSTRPSASSCTRRWATPVAAGEPLCTVLVNDETDLETALAMIRRGLCHRRRAGDRPRA